MIVATVTPAPRDHWSRVMELDDDSLVTQSPEWTDAICSAAGFRDGSRYYRMRDGNEVILPLVHTDGRLRLVRSAYSNVWGMGGLVSSSPLNEAHIRAVFDELSQTRFALTVIRPNPLHADTWAMGAPRPVRALPRRSDVVTLAGDFDAYWNALASRTRGKIRKAEKIGVTVECDTTGRLVPAFHELLMRSFERWGARVSEPRALARWRRLRRDPLSKFEGMQRGIGDRFRLWMASLEGRYIAAIIVLQGKNAHYYRGAMDAALVGNSYANHLLHKCAIEDAYQHGCHSYHMGESGDSVTLGSFKSQFAAVPHDCAEYRLERFPLTGSRAALRDMARRAGRSRSTAFRERSV